MTGDRAPWRTWLVLGRVSNLPTVWSNGLAGWALTLQAVDPSRLGLLLVALSLFYVGGMYLNDAFDAEVDARERSTRPIPAGVVRRRTVYVLGGAMLGFGIVLGFVAGVPAGMAGVALAASIVLYDALHKRVAAAPVIMGACRLFTYVLAALVAGGGLELAVLVGAAGLLCHTVGLTYAARQEAYNRIGSLGPLAVLAAPVLLLVYLAGGDALAILLLAVYVAWGLWSLRLLVRRGEGDVPRGVVSLIAGIALYDAAVIGASGAPVLAVAALGCFVATLALQKLVPGT